MAIKAINQSSNANYYSQKKQAFTGSFNPVVTVMDGIEKGGFIASFLAIDGIGMVAPRIYEGLNRNRAKDENGKKTGPLNWEFARREGIRELLSGPSSYLIPLGILSLVKKMSGTANNVHVSHIHALGENFASYAAKNPEQLQDTRAFKTGYYNRIFTNVLTNSFDNKLDDKTIAQKASTYAEKLVQSEELHKSKNKKGAKKALAELIGDYSELRKHNCNSSINELNTIMQLKDNDKPFITSIKRLTESLTNYTNDALEKTNKFIANNKKANVEEFVKEFNLHRSGTRVLTNLGMWGAVVGFYTLIPKLYNMGLKHDPGLKGLENSDNKQKDVSFTGNLTSKIGSKAIEKGKVSKLLNNFEFDGASMTVPAMLTLLFGFTLPPRYLNAKSDKERKEILVRDMSSFTAILFAAKALSRGFSNAFSNISGLALNIKPQDHDKSFLHKLKNYFTAGRGIDVLTSEQIVTKYSNIDKYRDGINGFFDFLQNNDGNVKKVLKIDPTVQEQAEKIMKNFGGKTIEDANLDEIKAAFKKAMDSKSEALEKIYSIFSAKDNKFVTKAKTLNSAFGFASTLVLVPAFMMWLARYCEKMTKKAVEKELAQKQNTVNQQPVNNFVASNKPTMAGFLTNS